MEQRAMKTGTTELVLALSFITSSLAALGWEPAAAPLSTTAPTNGMGPRIQFATPVYDFGKVLAGETAKCEFVFTNTGDQVLEVTAVQPGCHCTTVGDWSHQVEPGKTGTIVLQYDSAGLPSGPVERTATVTCTDPNQPVVGLRLKGTIWSAIDVVPVIALINVLPDMLSNAPAVVHITNNLKEPLLLSAPESSSPAYAAELQTNQFGRDYQLIVRALPPVPAGTSQGKITLRTSFTNKPLLEIPVWANVQPVLVAMPNQITLPPGAISNKQPYTVTIQKNGNKPVALSEPSVNIQRVGVELKETQPGRQFVVALTFPEGFQIPPGAKVELSVKSDNPLCPIFSVPIVQPLPAPTRVLLQRPALSGAVNLPPPHVGR